MKNDVRISVRCPYCGFRTTVFFNSWAGNRKVRCLFCKEWIPFETVVTEEIP